MSVHDVNATFQRRYSVNLWKVRIIVRGAAEPVQIWKTRTTCSQPESVEWDDAVIPKSGRMCCRLPVCRNHCARCLGVRCSWMAKGGTGADRPAGGAAGQPCEVITRMDGALRLKKWHSHERSRGWSRSRIMGPCYGPCRIRPVTLTGSGTFLLLWMNGESCWKLRRSWRATCLMLGFREMMRARWDLYYSIGGSWGLNSLRADWEKTMRDPGVLGE